ncbi:glycosyltransferase [Intrasporangium calvum]|uniref:Glycosyl transferase group 1 n=1 Tax=Intrasporangium calvum (strain ATCC 23552 / DSM 43043 / JCM 3097 / NBRC 12989 / NCIMB 10167 / NRRL B-3866 / 7 KIP) TaxID=710696 RepID=E6SE46_INTC7|nr:glycosyltransferase [Intrasporangium calvum]ADU47659.1 hypothetical protein Intca_1140 [Intrasporangium calvum DSM 43043]
MAYTPVGRTNPYQALLYRSVEAYGVATTPIVKSWQFEQLSRVANLVEDMVLHIHWTSFVLDGIQARPTARKKISQFKSAISSFKGSGGRLTWTLHNIVPHDSNFPDLEIEIQQFLADEADVLHALSYASLDVMEELISFDRGKVIVVPHPNYRLAYENYVTRSDARLAFGLEAHDRVYVLLGALKPYKGLDVLFQAFEQFCAEDPTVSRKLLVGGRPDDNPEVRSFVRDCENSPNVLIEPKMIAPHFIQYYLRAADVGLASYSRMLNSGALLLYQTFDLPVITSSSPALWEHMTKEIAECVGTPDIEGLLGALRKAERFFGEDVGPKVRSYAEGFDATALSHVFVSQLMARLAS